MYEIYQKLRDERGYKDSDVAREADVAKSTFSDWKAGRSKPGYKKLERIAKVLDTSVKYLMTGKEEDPEEENRSKVVNVNLQLEKILKADTLMFDGKLIDPESAELLQTQIEIALKTIRLKKKK